ncbi:MAG: hypothetical protein HY738_23930 [Bacteroidia bacterium]|nr:hypothetical protein [Bacteroidia bacterium]
MNSLEYLIRLDKREICICSIDEKFSDRNFWLSKSPQERFIALELLRQRLFGYDITSARLQRFFEVAEQVY